jgi:pimeloyl-ACP methyl ester carboxylesterase
MSSPSHSSSVPTLVLMAGAGLGPWLWEPLVPHLASPHLALQRPAPQPGVRLAHQVEHALAQLPAEGPLVLVMHSGAGVLGRALAVRLGHRVVGLVGVGALVPPAGGAFLHCFPQPQHTLLGWIIRLVGTRPPTAALRGELCSGLAPQDAEFVVGSFVPESQAYYRDTVGPEAFPEVPALYVHTTQDKSVDMALQSRQATRLPHATTHTMESGHLPMREQPRELAQVMDRFAKATRA